VKTSPKRREFEKLPSVLALPSGATSNAGDFPIEGRTISAAASARCDGLIRFRRWRDPLAPRLLYSSPVAGTTPERHVRVARRHAGSPANSRTRLGIGAIVVHQEPGIEWQASAALSGNENVLVWPPSRPLSRRGAPDAGGGQEIEQRPGRKCRRQSQPAMVFMPLLEISVQL